MSLTVQTREDVIADDIQKHYSITTSVLMALLHKCTQDQIYDHRFRVTLIASWRTRYPTSKNWFHSKINWIYEAAGGGGLPKSVYNFVSAVSSRQLQMHKMPYPLIEANVAHFAGEHVKIWDEYHSWLETMYAHFGKKFVSLFCAPPPL